MDFSKDFVYNHDKIVLLVCDYYETIHIPRGMYSVKDNLALFPVANIPLIEFILTNLSDQKFKNIIITGTKIDSLVDYLEKTIFFDALNIRILRSDGSSIGDVFRQIDDMNIEFKDLIVMYANHYTNIPLKKLLKLHKKAKNKLLTLFTYKFDTNDNHIHVYATKNKDVVLYNKLAGNFLSSQDILESVNIHKTIEIDSSHSSPTIAVVSNKVFPLFTENFDYNTIGDLIEGVTASRLYGNCIQLIRDEDLYPSLKKSEPQTTPPQDFVNKEREKAPDTFYSREINTLLDYFKFNQDLADNPSITRSLLNLERIKSTVKNTNNVQNSIIGESCEIRADVNVYNCVVWDNITLQEDQNETIVFSNEDKVNVFYLRSIEPDQASKDESEKKIQTFFDDINDYLRSCVTTARFYDLDMGDVSKQISLLRIVWNATRQEVIEAYAYFLVDVLDLNNLEDTMSKSSVFFDNLATFIYDESDQALLMNSLYENLSEQTTEVKATVFFNYAYLLVQDNIVNKTIVRKFKKLYNEGLM